MKYKRSKKSSKEKNRTSCWYTSFYSRQSCSTCHGWSSSPGDNLSVKSRWRSPMRKSKLRVRGRSSERDSSQRSRYISPSCSASSAGGRIRSPRKDAFFGRMDVYRHTRTKLSDDERISITIRRHEKKGQLEEVADVRKKPGEGESYKKRPSVFRSEEVADVRKKPGEDESYKKRPSVFI